MKRFLYIFIISFLFTAHVSYSKEAVDLGFAPGSVWSSLDEFFAEDTVEVGNSQELLSFLMAQQT